MINHLDPDITELRESWASANVSDTELGISGYVVLQKDRMTNRGCGEIFYMRNSILVVQVHIDTNADQSESLWCNIEG